MTCRCHACWPLREAVLDPLQSKAYFTMSKAHKNKCDADFVLQALFVVGREQLEVRA